MTQENTHPETDAAHAPPESLEQPGPAEPLRVGFLATGGTLRHFARVIHPLVIGLADERVTSTLFQPNRADQGELLGPGVETVRYASRRLFPSTAKTAADLGEKVRAEKIDLLHALDAESVALVDAAAGLAEINYVVSSHCAGDGIVLGTRGTRCAAVLAASKAIRNDLVEHHVAAAEKIHLMRPGVYHTRYPTCFCEDGRSIAIVAGGSTDSPEAWNAVLKTFAELKSRESDSVFFVIVPGRCERTVRRLARQYDLLPHVTFIDQKIASQFSGIVKASDVYISVAAGRELDVRTLLAMANGSLVLAAADATADFILDGKTAVVFTQGDDVDLTTKLVAMLDDPSAARALASVALAYVAEHHSPTASITALNEIYRNARVDATLVDTAVTE